jgi:hypothetical protein
MLSTKIWRKSETARKVETLIFFRNFLKPTGTHRNKNKSPPFNGRSCPQGEALGPSVEDPILRPHGL